MKKISDFVKKHKFYSAIIIVVLVVGGYFWYAKAHSTVGAIQYITQAAQKTTITVAVTGSGQVSEQNKIDLKPQSSGALTSVSVKQGDQVKSGQAIATVDQKNNLASLNQTKAALASAQANYQKVISGATSADVQTSKVSVDSAQLSLDNANASYKTIVQQQQLAVGNALSALLNSTLAAQASSGNISTATIAVTGSYSGTAQGQYKITTGSSGAGYTYDVQGLDTANGIIVRGIPIAIGSKGLYMTFSTTGNLYSGDSWIISIPNIQASNYLTNNNAYQGALLAQTTALANAQSAIKSAEIGLEQAQAAFDLKVQAAPPADVAAAEAQVKTAEAQVQAAEISYNNNIITAPFDGQVAQLNNQVGDQVSAATIVATLITNQKIAQIALNEVDVAKIQVGQKATLTFDAIGGLSISGTVGQIDTIGTVAQGVVTYNVKIAFDTQDERVKPGMSVTAAVITNVKTDVVAVPNSAVQSDSSGSFVQELDAAGKPQPVAVQTGISNDTLTEITSGVSEGQEVVTQTINPNAKSTTSTTAGGALRLGGGGFGGGGGGFGGNAVRIGGGSGGGGKGN